MPDWLQHRSPTRRFRIPKRRLSMAGIVVFASLAALAVPEVTPSDAATASTRRARATSTTEARSRRATTTTVRRRPSTTTTEAPSSGASSTTVAARSTARRTLFIPGAGRVLDLGPADVAKLASGGRVEADVRGAAGLAASGTGSVIVDVTASSPAQGGKVTLTPAAPEYARSVISTSVTFVAGSTTVSRVAVPVGRDGLVRVDTTPGPAGLTVTVVGWVVTAPESVAEPSGVPLQTCRILDTSTGAGGVSGPLTPGRAFDIPGTGIAQIPNVSSATPPAMVIYSVTMREMTGNPDVIVVPTGSTTPELRIVGSAGTALSAVVALPVGVDPRLAFYPTGTGSTQLSVEAIGWVDRNGAAKSGGPCQ
jgi:hypothetical protein